MAPVQIWISALTLIVVFSRIDSMSIRFYHRSQLNYTVTSVDQPLILLPFFNTTLVSKFYIFSVNETVNSESTTLIVSAYLNRGNNNVLVVDWSNEAHTDETGFVLSNLVMLGVAQKAKLVGKDLGRALLKFIQNGISQDKIHLVGYSVGAHVAGYAGKFVKDNNIELARITGLDPTDLVFEGMVSSGINPTTAKFVDALHTNQGQLGISTPVGSVDFWANCENAIQLGCELQNVTSVLNQYLQALCSTRRSFQLLTASIQRPLGFVAGGFNICANWMDTDNFSQVTYLGDLVDTSARGNFFFSTNDKEPFERGQAGLVPNN